MPHWDFARSINGIRVLINFAERQGLSAREALLGTQITTDQLDEHGTIVSAQQELRLISNLIDALGDSTKVGLEAGSHYHFTAFGPLGLAAASARTGLEALAFGAKYFQLTYAFGKLILNNDNPNVQLELDYQEIPERTRRFVVIRDVAAIMNVFRDFIGEEGLVEALHLNFPPPRDAIEFERFFGVAPKFNQDRAIMFLNRDIMEREMSMANKMSFEMAAKQCEELMNQRKVRSGFSASIRNYLATRLADKPSMQELAEHFAMTERTLRRKLTEEGSSFIELKNEVRWTLAEQYLVDLKMSVEQCAYSLGYGDTTSFINGFKKQYKLTPHAFRLSRLPNS